MQFNAKLTSLVLACLAGVSMPAFASNTISFAALSSAGFRQDSPVAQNYFASEGLQLSAGAVTACGGECLSSPAGTYRGSITGTFTGGAYDHVEFVGVTGSQSISLYDVSHDLIATLSAPTGKASEPTFEGGGNFPDYVYSGSVGVASFTTNLRYDGLISLTTDGQVSAVPESGSTAMMLAGLGLLGVAVRRRAQRN